MGQIVRVSENMLPKAIYVSMNKTVTRYFSWFRAAVGIIGDNGVVIKFVIFYH